MGIDVCRYIYIIEKVVHKSIIRKNCWRVFPYNRGMSKLRNTIYYEFRTVDQPDAVVKTGLRTIGPISITTGVDSVPTMALTIPLEDLPDSELEKIENGTVVEPRLQRYNITVYIQSEGRLKYRFNGTIDSVKVDYANYSVALTLSHKIARMREWPMPANYCVKSKPISEIVSNMGAALGYSAPPVGNGQNFTMQSYNQEVWFKFANQETANVSVTMAFGSSNKLAALSELLKNTESLHFAVDLSATQDTILISAFDRESCSDNTLISPFPFEADECTESPYHYVTMLTEPVFDVNYTDHFNRAIVFCGDVQDGVNHLTLGALDGQAPTPGFPVGHYEYELNQNPETQWDENGKKINNEKVYGAYGIIAYNQNGNREYYVEDSWQLEQDEGIVYNTVFNFNDLYPIPNLKEDIDDDGELEELVITDGDRSEIMRQVYMRAIRKLKSQRPQHTYQFNCTALPYGTSDGQRIRLFYAKSVNRMLDDEDGCQIGKVKIVNVDECLYMTKRTITFDESMNEITTITLDRELRVRDISATEVELREKAAEPGGAEQVYHPDLGVLTYGDNYWREYGSTGARWSLPAPKVPNTGVPPDL